MLFKCSMTWVPILGALLSRLQGLGKIKWVDIWRLRRIGQSLTWGNHPSHYRAELTYANNNAFHEKVHMVCPPQAMQCWNPQWVNWTHLFPTQWPHLVTQNWSQLQSQHHTNGQMLSIKMSHFLSHCGLPAHWWPSPRGLRIPPTTTIHSNAPKRKQRPHINTR